MSAARAVRDPGESVTRPTIGAHPDGRPGEDPVQVVAQHRHGRAGSPPADHPDVVNARMPSFMEDAGSLTAPRG
ncbi:predicted protein [Streptomyces sp. C]|nr:predicted protein [Streptomyces sp. C]